MSSYTDETVRSKLSALNDSQDAIVAVAQWIMFHRRQAKRSAELWLERLKESSSHRKLMLVYLANEIVQQSKARNKPEFGNAFTPIVVESIGVAYDGCKPDVQEKIKRVVQVWRERNIFKSETQAEIEQRIETIERKGSGPSKSVFGGGLKLGSGFLGGGGKGPDVPLEFVPLMKTHKEIRDKASSVTIATGTANTEYQKQFDTEHLPAPPVYAARLSALLKTLDTADSAIKGAIEARKAHIRNIERLLEQSKTALAKDEQTAAELQKKKEKTESTKESVENLIMKDLEESNGNGNGGGDGTPGDKTPDLKSPEIEALTPPAQILHEPEPPTPASELHHRHSIAPAAPPYPPDFHAGASELLASLSAPLHNAGGLKRTQVEDTNMFEGIDEDLVNMFKNEGVQQQQQQQQQQKRQKFEPEENDDDEYVP
ncbi:RNA polymerase II-binding domain-containing protein [Sphaerosporella brunnea]|uniref:RNA polymerase II-binding domain-containing protein n=1 Tax=Sphaerosporella brunnea TaxID=1250544 RepID=A0A5J5EY98_9PEZI|nr:RNA polymerase II-binding domain-containing protein [Sphaerosporella brunnea]